MMNLSQHGRALRLALVLSLTLLLGAMAILPAQAAEPRTGDRVVIARDEIITDNLYAAGSTVIVDGTIKGDLVAAAQQVVVNGTVEGDVLVVAQSVIISGQVADDVRAMAQAIMLAPGARVGGDLAVGTASLENQAGSVVSGDLLAGGYQALLAGEIGRDVRAGMNRMELHGTVGGDVDVAVGGDNGGMAAIQISPPPQMAIPSVQPNLTVADSARIGGKLNYTSTAEGIISSQAVPNGVAFNRTEPQVTQPESRLPGLAYLQRLAALLLVGVLLLWLLPRWTSRLSETVSQQPLPSLGWGVVAFGAVFTAIVGILFISIVLAIIFGYLRLGGLAALLVFVGLLINSALILSAIAFCAYIAEVVVGFMAGRWLLQRVQPAWAERPFAPLVLGIVLYVALRAIPVVGGFVALLVALLGMGALWTWGRVTFRRMRPAAPAPIGGLQPV